MSKKTKATNSISTRAPAKDAMEHAEDMLGTPTTMKQRLERIEFDIENYMDHIEIPPPLNGKKESPNARWAFVDYCKLGRQRRLALLLQYYTNAAKVEGADVPTTSPRTLQHWHRTLHWDTRAADWDKQEEVMERALWRKRQDELRNADWKMGQQIRQLAIDLLELSPKFLKTSKPQPVPGDPNKHIVRVGIDAEMIPKLARTASELQTAAAFSQQQLALQQNNFFVRNDGDAPVQITAFDYMAAIAPLSPSASASKEPGDDHDVAETDTIAQLESGNDE